MRCNDDRFHDLVWEKRLGRVRVTDWGDWAFWLCLGGARRWGLGWRTQGVNNTEVVDVRTVVRVLWTATESSRDFRSVILRATPEKQMWFVATRWMRRVFASAGILGPRLIPVRLRLT